MAEEENNSDDETRPPAWEWVLAGIGVLLVVSVISAMVYRGVTGEDGPPSFEVTVSSTAASGDGYVATFRIMNLGSKTAANLTVDGKLQQGSQMVESATVNLAYVPGNSERSGGLFFKNDPSQFDLQIRATGYEEP